MKTIQTAFPEVLLIEPTLFGDSRGYFAELFQCKRYEALGIPSNMVQDNLSLSMKNSVRGLHYQLPHPQGKLVTVLKGRVLDVVVDIRRGSPHFGKSISFVLDGDSHRQAYIPPGFAHGFCTLEDHTLFMYKCTDYYSPSTEKGILWNDPALGINWPNGIDAILSKKDAAYPTLADVAQHDLPIFELQT